jgi:fluoride ion exporter CrcB/FEX
MLIGTLPCYITDIRIVPIIGSGVFSAGVLGTFMPISTYLIDAYQLYAASALAASTVLRSLTGALLPLAGPAMVRLRLLGFC